MQQPQQRTSCGLHILLVSVVGGWLCGAVMGDGGGSECGAASKDLSDADVKQLSGGAFASCADVKAAGYCGLDQGGTLCCVTCGHTGASEVAPDPEPVKEDQEPEPEPKSAPPTLLRCATGWSYSASSSTCEPCPAGTFATQNATTGCKPCEAGTVDHDGSPGTQCVAWAEGRYTDSSGQSLNSSNVSDLHLYRFDTGSGLLHPAYVVRGVRVNGIQGESHCDGEYHMGVYTTEFSANLVWPISANQTANSKWIELAEQSYQFRIVELPDSAIELSDNYSSLMISACAAADSAMKPICYSPDFCKDDESALFIGQDSGLASPIDREFSGQVPRGFFDIASKWDGLCNYAGVGNGNAEAMCNTQSNLVSWKTPTQYNPGFICGKMAQTKIVPKRCRDCDISAGVPSTTTLTHNGAPVFVGKRARMDPRNAGQSCFLYFAKIGSSTGQWTISAKIGDAAGWSVTLPFQHAQFVSHFTQARECVHGIDICDQYDAHVASGAEIRTLDSKYTMGAQCTACPDRSSTTTPGSATCTCDLGFSGNASITGCHACSPGTFDTQNATTGCKPCEAGTVDHDGSPGTQCVACAEGRYTDSSGQSLNSSNVSDLHLDRFDTGSGLLHPAYVVRGATVNMGGAKSSYCDGEYYLVPGQTWAAAPVFQGERARIAMEQPGPQTCDESVGSDYLEQRGETCASLKAERGCEWYSESGYRYYAPPSYTLLHTVQDFCPSTCNACPKLMQQCWLYFARLDTRVDDLWVLGSSWVISPSIVDHRTHEHEVDWAMYVPMQYKNIGSQSEFIILRTRTMEYNIAPDIVFRSMESASGVVAECSVCPPGTKTSGSGSDSCECKLGFRSDPSGCQACPPSTFAGQRATECHACPKGRVDHDALASTECLRCTPGTYLSSSGAILNNVSRPAANKKFDSSTGLVQRSYTLKMFGLQPGTDAGKYNGYEYQPTEIVCNGAPVYESIGTQTRLFLLAAETSRWGKGAGGHNEALLFNWVFVSTLSVCNQIREDYLTDITDTWAERYVQNLPTNVDVGKFPPCLRFRASLENCPTPDSVGCGNLWMHAQSALFQELDNDQCNKLPDGCAVSAVVASNELGTPCDLCPPGSWSPRGSTSSQSCVACPAGQASATTADGIECEPCAPGRFADKDGSVQPCTACAPGTVSDEGTSDPACQGCAPGRYFGGLGSPYATTKSSCASISDSGSAGSAVGCLPTQNSQPVFESAGQTISGNAGCATCEGLIFIGGFSGICVGCSLFNMQQPITETDVLQLPQLVTLGWGNLPPTSTYCPSQGSGDGNHHDQDGYGSMCYLCPPGRVAFAAGSSSCAAVDPTISRWFDQAHNRLAQLSPVQPVEIRNLAYTGQVALRFGMYISKCQVAINVDRNGSILVTDSIFIANENVNNGGKGGAIKVGSGVLLRRDPKVFEDVCVSADSEGAPFGVCITEVLKSRGIDTLRASYAKNLHRSAYVKSGVFAASGARAIVNSSSFTDNSAVDGGAIFVAAGAQANITKCQFTGNKASRFGGAISAADGVYASEAASGSILVEEGIHAHPGGCVTVVDSVFTNNTAGMSCSECGSHPTDACDCEGSGGAIYVGIFGTLHVIASVFSSNTASTDGGAITCAGPVSFGAGIVLDPFAFDGATSALRSLYSRFASRTIVDRSSFVSNAALCRSSGYAFCESVGGAIYGLEFANLSLSRTSFHRNKASMGGAILSQSLILSATDSIWTENAAEESETSPKSPGGAITLLQRLIPDRGDAPNLILELSKVSIVSSTFQDNTAYAKASLFAFNIGYDINADSPLQFYLYNTSFATYNPKQSVSLNTLSDCNTFPCQLGFSCDYKRHSLHCVPCAEGQVGLDGITCSLCQPGEQPNAARSACEPCSNSTHSRFGFKCIKCSVNTVPAVIAGRASTCTSCPPGSGTVDSEHCTPCTGMREASPEGKCEQCQAGSQPSGDKTFCVQCLDLPGPQSYWVSSDGALCQQCEPGTQPDAQRKVCLPCEDDGTVLYYSSDGTTCEACWPNSQPSPDRSNCVCVDGYVFGKDDNRTCVDVNECGDASSIAQAGVCNGTLPTGGDDCSLYNPMASLRPSHCACCHAFSQGCNNAEGHFTCQSCVPGLVGRGYGPEGCKLPSPEPTVNLIGCDGLPFAAGGKIKDACGLCGGDNGDNLTAHPRFWCYELIVCVRAVSRHLQ